MEGNFLKITDYFFHNLGNLHLSASKKVALEMYYVL